MVKIKKISCAPENSFPLRMSKMNKNWTGLLLKMEKNKCNLANVRSDIGHAGVVFQALHFTLRK